MPPTSRHRERDTDQVSGSYTYNGGSPVNRQTYSVTESCDDIIGDYGQDHAFLHEKSDVVPFTMNGSGNNYECTNWHQQVASPPHQGSPTSASSLATMAAARTNPSRPHILLPTAVFELRDVPRLLKLAGGSLLRKGAGANLSYEFGWKPLLNDIKSLLDFDTAYTKRREEIEKLMSNGGLKRRVRLGGSSVSTTGTKGLVLSSPYALRVEGTPTTTTTREYWATLRWMPNPTFTGQTDAKRNAALRRTLLGLDPSQITQNVWNALPWTWLLDWTGNVGSFLEASNNSVAYLPQQVNVMIMTKTERKWTLSRIPTGMSLSVSEPLATRVTKQRTLTSPSLSASIPFLNGRQMGILASLAILRSR
ncbi:MAG: putative maturation protein [Hampduvirus faecihabitans]|uniref:Maturation protein n=1 Tax=Leviviridae sp. TaxID=2027243 RepID=A0ABY3SSL8_9VIRU|nr:MAG: putative maturation protein [Leviviridae sp.]